MKCGECKIAESVRKDLGIAFCPKHGAVMLTDSCEDFEKSD